jgi:hypothetical protein
MPMTGIPDRFNMPNRIITSATRDPSPVSMLSGSTSTPDFMATRTPHRSIHMQERPNIADTTEWAVG